MPTYQYSCSKCGKEFELFQSMKDPALKICPKEKCQMRRWGRGKVQRHVGTGAGIIFKGSGFYITDYRSENYKSAAKKETESNSGSSGSGDGKKKTDAAAPAPAKTPTKSSSDTKGSKT